MEETPTSPHVKRIRISSPKVIQTDPSRSLQNNCETNSQLEEAGAQASAPQVTPGDPSTELEQTRACIRQAVKALNRALGASEEDECDLYGRFLAGRLRQMPLQQRWQFMHDVDGLYLRHCPPQPQPTPTPHRATRSSSESSSDSDDV